VYQCFEPRVEKVGQLMVCVTHDAELVRSLVDAWHSWRDAPQGWRVAFILTDGLAIYGVSTFGRPVARKEDQVHTMEHTRMALGPGAPRNSASFFMAGCRRWIRGNMRDCHRLISYVPSHEYSGVTYRADNWRIVYENQPNRSSWRNRDGRKDSGNEFRTKFEREP
jgi:hypothetical protein